MKKYLFVNVGMHTLWSCTQCTYSKKNQKTYKTKTYMVCTPLFEDKKGCFRWYLMYNKDVGFNQL
jgi:hypothetical protein